MSLNIDRRSFLMSLMALGAGYALSKNATAREVSQTWEKALADPWYFCVDDYGTITESGYPENEKWGEIFDISASYLKTPTDIVDEVSKCQPLTSHFQMLASDGLDALRAELEEKVLPTKRTKHISRVIKALQDDPDHGWMDWVELEGNAGVERFKQELASWADGPADYMQSEWFPPSYGAQGQAKLFFESLSLEILDDLNVVIVEGEHPGSTYYAAELRRSVEDANDIAVRLELPFRFKPEAP